MNSSLNRIDFIALTRFPLYSHVASPSTPFLGTIGHSPALLHAGDAFIFDADIMADALLEGAAKPRLQDIGQYELVSDDNWFQQLMLWHFFFLSFLCSLHGKRVTLMVKDLELARKLRKSGGLT